MMMIILKLWNFQNQHSFQLSIKGTVGIFTATSKPLVLEITTAMMQSYRVFFLRTTANTVTLCRTFQEVLLQHVYNQGYRQRSSLNVNGTYLVLELQSVTKFLPIKTFPVTYLVSCVTRCLTFCCVTQIFLSVWHLCQVRRLIDRCLTTGKVEGYNAENRRLSFIGVS